MPLIDQTGLIDDPWIRVADDGDLPASGPVLVSIDRLDAAAKALADSGQPLGVEIACGEGLSAIAPWYGRVGLIAIRFSSFSDGRGFSMARRIRLEGYARALRAAGPLIADQFAFARACGFDSIELDDALAARQPIGQWLAAAEAISISYQRGYAGALNALDARRQARRALPRIAGGGWR